MKLNDVLVVGAGPAGSTAARALARRGLEVVLLDKARFPRDKPCGGGVTIRCASLLDFDLGPVVERVVSGAVLTGREGGPVVRDHDAPLTYMTQRSRLDAFLVERAQEAGVDFRDGQAVRSVERLPGGGFEVRVRGASGASAGGGGDSYRARVVIGADGANGVVAGALGFEPPREAAVALEANLPCPDGVPAWLEGRVALSLGLLPGGYGWLFPKGDHINVGVGGWKARVGTNLRASLDAYCRASGFDSAQLRQHRGHHLPMQRPGAPVVAEGAALVGDAAGFVDPLSGEGIYAAIASGLAVAPAVEDYLAGRVDSLAGYQRAVERELVADLRASNALMEVFHAWPGPFTWGAKHSRRVWARMAGVVRGEQTYEGIVQSTGPLAWGLGPLAGLARRTSHRQP